MKKAAEGFAVNALASLIANLWIALWTMLALGVLHSQWPSIPALGYWATYLVLTGLLALIGAARLVGRGETA